VLLGAAAVATVFPLWMALSVHSLSGSNLSLGTREAGGGQFAVVLVLSLVALYFGGRRLLDREDRIQLSPERARRLMRLLIAGVGVAVVIALIAVAFSSRGLGGTISHAWDSFTTPHATANVNNPNVSFDSGNRWVWWKEAVGAFSDRPFGGWGAGSFQVLDLMYRTTGNLTVQDAHSVPLQWLAETGLVGGLLAIGGFALLLAGGLDAARRKTGVERAFAAALFAAGVAYAVHAFYDWDWDLPGVTFPVLVFLGVLVGSGLAHRHGRVLQRPAGARGLALAVCTLVLCAYALSALLPSLSATKASSSMLRAPRSSARDSIRSPMRASRRLRRSRSPSTVRTRPAPTSSRRSGGTRATRGPGSSSRIWSFASGTFGRRSRQSSTSSRSTRAARWVASWRCSSRSWRRRRASRRARPVRRCPPADPAPKARLRA
jgi:hypothetical protein